jgi:orotate phosphoribosyltransferase
VQGNLRGAGERRLQARLRDDRARPHRDDRDILTTGLSSRECLAAVAEQPGRVLGAACLIDRSGGRADLGVPLVALVELDIPNYSPDHLPPELAAIPAVKPGSRNIEA